MWLSNSRNNFAPFAGYMLMGYDKRGPVERIGKEFIEAVEDVRAGVKTTGGKADDVALS